MQFLRDVKLSDFNFKNVLKFCKGYCNNQITERIEVINLHIKFPPNLNTHKIISRINIKLNLSLEMGKYKVWSIMGVLCSQNIWMVVTLIPALNTVQYVRT